MTRLQAAPTQAVQTECVCKRWGIWGLASKWPPTLPICLPFAFFFSHTHGTEDPPHQEPHSGFIPFLCCWRGCSLGALYEHPTDSLPWSDPPRQTLLLQLP